MPNRVISVNYNEQQYLIHLYYNEEKINVILLDPPLKEALCVESFAINHLGELIEEESCTSGNAIAVKELYSTIVRQNAEAINAFLSQHTN
jgi:hypothetical protein